MKNANRNFILTFTVEQKKNIWFSVQTCEYQKKEHFYERLV